MILYLIFFVAIKYINADNASSKLIEQAVHITNEHYDHRLITTVVWTKNHSEEVTDYLKKFPGTVVKIPLINNDDSTLLDTTKNYEYSQIVFFVAEPDDFKKFMKFISAQTRFSIRLVLILNRSVGKRSALSTFMEIAWQNNLADIVIINKNERNEIILSTYFPYNNGICGNYDPVTLKPNENVFPNKFKNFNRCPIKASVRPHPPLVSINYPNDTFFELRGYDGLIFTIILDALNASLEVKVLPHYGFYSDGAATYGFSDLVNNITDILVPGGILAYATYSIAQASHGYYDSNVRWVGPKRRVIHEALKLLMPFLQTDTLFISLVFTLFVIVAILIRKRAIYNTSNRVSLCFQTFSLMVGQVVTCITSVPLLNSFFLLWIWFSFIIRIEYQGSLFNSLQSEILEPQLTVKDAFTRVDGYGGFIYVLEFYKDTPLEKDFIVMGQTVFNNYLDRVIKGGNFLLASDALTFARARHSVQVLDEPISKAMTCFYMRPGWPAAKAVDSIVVAILETGIADKIFSTDDQLEALRYHKDEDKKVYPLDISLVISCFYAMGVMWVGGLLTFITEIMYYKYSQKYRHH